jgi:hypothetical protein
MGLCRYDDVHTRFGSSKSSTRWSVVVSRLDGLHRGPNGRSAAERRVRVTGQGRDRDKGIDEGNEVKRVGSLQCPRWRMCRACMACRTLYQALMASNESSNGGRFGEAVNCPRSDMQVVGPVVCMYSGGNSRHREGFGLRSGAM